MSTFKMSSIVWSEPHLTTTKGGARRQVRTWFIPRQSSFWSLWNNTKSTLKQRGYSVTKWQDRWMLNECGWWVRARNRARESKLCKRRRLWRNWAAQVPTSTRRYQR